MEKIFAASIVISMELEHFADLIRKYAKVPDEIWNKEMCKDFWTITEVFVYLLSRCSKKEVSIDPEMVYTVIWNDGRHLWNDGVLRGPKKMPGEEVIEALKEDGDCDDIIVQGVVNYDDIIIVNETL